MNSKLLKQLKVLEKAYHKKLDEFKKNEFQFTFQKSIEIYIKGSLEIMKIQIHKELIDPQDPQMLEEMLVEAINEAIMAVKEEEAAIAEQFK